jgi:hypothetical protein
MKVTVILKDFTEQFYNGFGESIPGLLNMANPEKFEKLRLMSAEKRVTMRIGNGSFRDQVDLNSIRKSQHPQYSFKIEPRKGYKLATFEITA